MEANATRRRGEGERRHLRGALTGRLVIATSGRDYVLTDGASFDWPGAPKKPTSDEIVALEAGAPLPHAALVARRDAALLGKLTR